MASQRQKKTRKDAPDTDQPSAGWGGNRARYINPHTDFGFKKLFGTEANKDLLQEFLPVILGKEDRIVSLRYMNPEQLGRSESDRKAVYDIYCETDSGEKFIVEMQRTYQEFFKDRSVYYSTFPIQEQAKKGVNWDFELNAVYTVGILNFEFKDGDGGSAKQYPWLHHVQLSDTETGKIFYGKLTYVYLELPKFTKTEDELETLMDKWMFVLKNLPVLDDRPKALQERVFKRLFRIAEIEQMSEAERFAYRESQKIYWDYMNSIRSAEKKVAGEKDAIIREKDNVIREKDDIIQKHKEAILEKDAALLEKDKSFVKKLLEKGFSAEQISEIMNLPVDRVNELTGKA